MGHAPTSRAATYPQARPFEITRIDWQATTHGDSTSSGGMRIEIAGERIPSLKQSPGMSLDSWSGTLTLGPGDTSRAFVELGSFSECEVVFHGTWHDTLLDLDQAMGEGALEGKQEK